MFTSRKATGTFTIGRVRRTTGSIRADGEEAQIITGILRRLSESRIPSVLANLWCLCAFTFSRSKEFYFALHGASDRARTVFSAEEAIWGADASGKPG